MTDTPAKRKYPKVIEQTHRPGGAHVTKVDDDKHPPKMDRFTAHAQFCMREDGGLSLLAEGTTADLAPVIAATLASLSGQLHNCKTQADLDEAVAHGRQLVEEGQLGIDDLECETDAILHEISEWGRRTEWKLSNAPPL